MHPGGWSVSLDPTVDDPLFHCFWEALSERAQVVVAREADQIAAKLRAHAFWAPLSCTLASEQWAAAFRAEGVPTRMVYGHYWPGAREDLEPPASSDHAWLVVDGAIFDPTAGQFGDQIKVRHYHEAGAST